MRRLVSKDARRFQQGSYDLDLSYITPRIIAMGLPSSGIESIYRNKEEMVAQLLTERHGTNFMIYNLSGRTYTYELFNHQILEYPFPDHHNPPLHLLFKIVQSIHSWLSASRENVAAVHCLAGKGRTGTVIASYLMFAGCYNEPEQALGHFATARSHDGTGVRGPSQLRQVCCVLYNHSMNSYVRYFHSIIRQQLKFDLRVRSRTLRLTSVVFKPVPGFATLSWSCNPQLHVYDGTTDDMREIYASPWSPPGKELTLEHGSVIFNLEAIRLLLNEDVTIVVTHKRMRLGFESDVVMFRFSFYVGFIEDYQLLLLKNELDEAYKDHSCKHFDSRFLCFCKFEEQEYEPRREISDTWTPETYERFFAEAAVNQENMNGAKVMTPPRADLDPTDDFSMGTPSRTSSTASEESAGSTAQPSERARTSGQRVLSSSQKLAKPPMSPPPDHEQ